MQTAGCRQLRHTFRTQAVRDGFTAAATNAETASDKNFAWLIEDMSLRAASSVESVRTRSFLARVPFFLMEESSLDS